MLGNGLFRPRRHRQCHPTRNELHQAVRVRESQHAIIAGGINGVRDRQVKHISLAWRCLFPDPREPLRPVTTLRTRHRGLQKFVGSKGEHDSGADSELSASFVEQDITAALR